MKKPIALVLAAIACGGGTTEAPPPAATAKATVLPPAPSETASAPPPRASSEPAPAEPVPRSDAAQGTTVVDRDTWTTMFESALPVALCKSGSYFTSCFTISQVECEQTAASATRVCLGKVRKQLPAKFHQPDEGRDWGSRIGSCAGIAYEAALAPKKIHNAKCDDPSAWNGP